eukprot:8927515-Alexandrium_andersonii.AAC.1
MSASLVGSEMCIRDRRAGLLRGTSPKVGAMLRSGDCRDLGTQSAGSQNACLLYTSDAADDM